MSDTERDIADIKTTLARLETMLIKLLDGQAAQGERLARVEGRLTGVEGQVGVAVQWLQSVDNRFVALMHPFEPRKPAA
ncbi:MAG: hypothetical protein ABT940_10135 [Alphaproteobacteria bacterium]